MTVAGGREYGRLGFIRWRRSSWTKEKAGLCDAHHARKRQYAGHDRRQIDSFAKDNESKNCCPNNLRITNGGEIGQGKNGESEIVAETASRGEEAPNGDEKSVALRERTVAFVDDEANGDQALDKEANDQHVEENHVELFQGEVRTCEEKRGEQSVENARESLRASQASFAGRVFRSLGVLLESCVEQSGGYVEDRRATVQIDRFVVRIVNRLNQRVETSGRFLRRRRCGDGRVCTRLLFHSSIRSFMF